MVVHGPEDLDRACRILHGFDCEAVPMGRPPVPGADRSGPWQDWLVAANALMLDNPARATDRRVLAKMAPLGLGPAFDPARFTREQAGGIADGIAEATALSRGAGFACKQVGQWLYPACNMGNFQQDYLTRARIAVAGLAALPPSEACYRAAVPAQGRVFEGPGPWRLRFAADALPPVDAFWSLTM